MNIYPLNITTQENLRGICSKIGADYRALAYLAPKFRILHLYADDIDYRAASFLKQEMLARGGDTIVTKHVIDGKTDKSDILIMATPSQLRSLQEKLKAMLLIFQTKKNYLFQMFYQLHTLEQAHLKRKKIVQLWQHLR